MCMLSHRVQKFPFCFESCKVWQKSRIELHVGVTVFIVTAEKGEYLDLLLIDVNERVDRILLHKSLDELISIKLNLPICKCSCMYIIEPKLIINELCQEYLAAVELLFVAAKINTIDDETVKLCIERQ